MYKGLFICCSTLPKDEYFKTGVGKKVSAQITELRKYFDVELDLNRTGQKTETPITKVARRLPYTAIGYDWKYSPKYNGYDFIYFRKDVIDNSVYRFLNSIHKINPSCVIFFEIATYPYDKEVLKRAQDVPFFLKDVINRNRLRFCIDRISTPSSNVPEKIFGTPVSKFINGMNFSNIKKREVNQNNSKSINLISVTSFADWHGIDRIIKGLGDYYNTTDANKREVYLHLVGEGKNKASMIELSNKLHIKDYVIFYGFATGDRLDKIYNCADVGINSVALHRLGLSNASTLKSREYGAKGLPIVTSTPIDYLPDNYPYVFFVPEDDGPIDIDAIADYVDNLYLEKPIDTINDEIRTFAESKCDISVAIKPLINCIIECIEYRKSMKTTVGK